MTSTLRRGLPRAVAGEPWPPPDVVIRFDVAAVPDATIDASSTRPGAAAPSVAAESAIAEAAASAPASAKAGVPGTSGAPASPSVMRRGLPRTVGGEGWPPEDTTIRFEVVPAGGSIDLAGAAAPGDSDTPAPSATPSITSQPAAVDQPAAAVEASSAGSLRAEARRNAPSAPATATTTATSTAPTRAALGSVAAVPATAAKTGAGARESVAPAAVAKGPGRIRAMLERTGGATALIIGFVLGAVIAVAAVFLVRMAVWGTPAGVDFIERYPGEVHLPDWAPSGFPGWLMWQHWLNAFFMVLVIKTGWTIRRTTRPAAMWQPRRGGKKIAIEQWIHLSLDLLWLINGAIFVVLLFATGQWIRVVPFSWEFVPNAVSSALQYVSLSWPTENGWTNYNSLQVFAYFVTIFIAAPLAAITGFRMSPLWPSGAEKLSRIYPVEVARKIHFPVMLYFVFFIAMHVFLVFATGALRNLNHMFWGTSDEGSWAGFGMFALGMVVIVAAVLALRPFVVQQLGSLFGKVGR